MIREYVTFRSENQIGLLTINRPNALNALNSQVISELSAQLTEIEGSDIRCLIITGAGEKSFIAGADISEMKDLSADDAAAFTKAGNAVMNQLEAFPMPVIAAINGYAFGGGCELALACDIRIASVNAVFAMPEVSLGITPGYGGVQRLSRTIGLAKAKELIFTADRIKAGEAKELGLVSQVVAQIDLMNTCIEIAGRIVANAPVAVRAVKRIANAAARVNDTHGLEVQAFADCFKTADQYQAMTAFIEKRKPEAFTGKSRE